MAEAPGAGPDSTAVRVALWRALHVELDAPPPVFDDSLGLRLAAPDAGWRSRPDMHAQGTRGYRAAMVARSRFIEDLVAEEAGRGVTQYVLLGAGLDTFAQRRPELASRLRVFEVDKPGTLAWKRERLDALGFGVPDFLRLVPVDFEAGESWLEKLAAAGFDREKPSVFASAGVSMYLTKEATKDVLRKIASLAPGTTVVMTFLLTLDLIDPAEREQHKMVYERARASGTPFVSFYTPGEMKELAKAAGFRKAEHVSRADVAGRYFAGRSDGLVPASGEEYLVATV